MAAQGLPQTPGRPRPPAASPASAGWQASVRSLAPFPQTILFRHRVPLSYARGLEAGGGSSFSALMASGRAAPALAQGVRRRIGSHARTTANEQPLPVLPNEFIDTSCIETMRG